MLKAVTLTEIELVFSVIEPLGLSREAVVIPLRPADPGYVRKRADGRFEIGVDANVSTVDWLPHLRSELEALLRP